MKSATHRHTKEKAREILGQSMVALGLQDDMETSPGIIQDILREFRLDDLNTSNRLMDQFFDRAKSKPQTLRPLLLNVKNAIAAKHPAVVEFAELALKHDWLQPSEQALRAVHVGYILEALTAAMCNRHGFFLEVENHYKAHARRLGLDTKHLPVSIWHALIVTHDVFGTAKALSVDPAMLYLRLQKTELDPAQAATQLKTGKISQLESKFLSPLDAGGVERMAELLRINILEAGVMEYTKGFSSNAICGYELAQDILDHPPRIEFTSSRIVPESSLNPFYQSIKEDESQFLSVELSQEWVSLYTTWNLAFVLFNYDDLDLILPKLFIPSTVDAQGSHYIGARLISLWLTLHHYYFRKFDKRAVSGPEHKQEMARHWAAINRRYAIKLAKRRPSTPRRSLLATSKRWYRHGLYHLLSMVEEFLTR